MTCKVNLKKIALFSTIISILFSVPVNALSVSDLSMIDGRVLRKYSQNDIQFYEKCGGQTTASSSSSSTAVGGVAVISGNTAEEKVWSGLKSLGLSDEIAAGGVGNLIRECGLNPASYESVKTNFDYESNQSYAQDGVGLAQWSGPERVDFFKWMRSKNNDLVDKLLKDPAGYGQMSGDDFIKKVNNESEVNALYSLEITYIMEQLQSNDQYGQVLKATTVEDAASIWAEKYEICANCKAGQSENSRRVEEAKKAFERNAGKTYNSGSNGQAASTSANLDGSKVTIIGDSITNGARETFEKKLPGIDIHAQDSKHWDSSGGSSGGDAGIVILKNLIASNKLRETLIFALGTNDTLTDKNISDLLSTAQSPTKIVLVTNFDGGQPKTENNNKINGASSSDSRVVVADWASIASQHPEYFGSDGTHPKDATANEAFVDVILQAIGNIGTTTNQTSSSTDPECCGETQNTLGNVDGVYPGGKYNCFSDTEWRKLAAAAYQEQGSVNGSKREASLMANLFEDGGHGKGQAGDCQGLLNYVENGGWFGSNTVAAFRNGASFNNQEIIDAVKSVLADGNRTVPKEIIEHDCTGDILWLLDGDGNRHDNDGGAYGKNCGGKGLTDKSLYVRGKTEIHNNSGATYIFWDWANPEDQSGDPFGYYKDNPPAQTALQPTKGTSAITAGGSNVIWTDDGWIQAGIDGYVNDALEGKISLDSTFGQDYTTDGLKGDGKGPNKILLHATEGVGDGGNSVISVYKANGGVPPHFTIDMKNRKVYQHVSIWKTSSAIKGTDDGDLAAGVQIEIMGFDNLAQAGENTDWYLGSEEAFSDEDFLYLATLLNAISVETNIPLTSTVDWNGVKDNIRLSPEDFVKYTGILSHKHSPARDDVDDGSDNDGDHDDLVDEVVWKRIQKALQGFSDSQQTTTDCPPAGGVDVAALQNLVKEWVWKKEESNWNTPVKKDAYDAVIQRRISEGKYVGSMVKVTEGQKGGGVDCGGFVTTLMQESGWDPEYNPEKGNTTAQHQYLQSSPKWDEVTSTIQSNSNAKVGDVLIKENEGDSWHHTLVYVGKISGFNFAELAEAGQDQYAPSEGKQPDIMYWVRDQKFHVYRNNSPPTTGGGSVGDGGLTEAEAKQFMMNYGENKNGSSESAVPSLWSYCGGGGSNCVTFSAFFLNKFTQTPYAGGAGYAVAGALNTTKDGNPSVWSVFSYGDGCEGTSASGCINHTGVILGKQGNTWIVGHASCTRGNNGIRGKGDGTRDGGGSGYVIVSDDINAAIGNSSGKEVTYAHPQGVDTSAISSYLTNGT